MLLLPLSSTSKLLKLMFKVHDVCSSLDGMDGKEKTVVSWSRRVTSGLHFGGGFS